MNARKMYNTTLDSDLIREIKILAAKLEKRQNDLLEEAIQALLKKYKSKDKWELLVQKDESKPMRLPFLFTEGFVFQDSDLTDA